jgi:Domain of unknown function (DUF5615)
VKGTHVTVRAVIAFAAEEDLPVQTRPDHSMKIKLDENLPTRLAYLLKCMRHQVDTLTDEGLTGKPDTDVWIAAQKEGRFLITQDLDF